MAFRRLGRVLVGLITAFILVLVGGQAASAHVTVSGNVQQGGFGAMVFSVPTERDVPTIKLEVQIPDDVNLAFASAQAKPGWDVEVTKRTLDKPITDFGDPITEVVDTITWSGGEIGPGQYDTFGISGGAFPKDKDSVELKAIQTYQGGEEVAWIEPAPAAGEEEPEHPAPVLTLVAAEGEDGGATTTTKADDESAAGSSSSDDSSEDDDSSTGIAIAGLVIGLIALAGAGFAIVSSRKPSGSS